MKRVTWNFVAVAAISTIGILAMPGAPSLLARCQALTGTKDVETELSEPESTLATPSFAYTIAEHADCCLHIAHAGGMIDGVAYTNSPEAMKQNYAKGVRVFEIDFSTVGDGSIVIAHDFNDFDNPPASAAEFLGQSAAHGYDRLSFAALVDWMKSHPEAVIMTDTKFVDGPNRILDAFAPYFSETERASQLIVQVYDLDWPVPPMLYPEVPRILTVYRLGNVADADILAALQNNMPEALTMPAERAITSLPAIRDALPSLPIYLHASPQVINDPQLHTCMAGLGASGFYLD